MSLSMKDLQAQIDALTATVALQQESITSLQDLVQELQDSVTLGSNGRDRGPASKGSMTDAHAIRALIGDLKDTSNKEAALILGLSYGQIYSARKGYTFKKIYQRMIKGEVDHSYDQPFEDGESNEDVLADQAVDTIDEIQEDEA